MLCRGPDFLRFRGDERPIIAITENLLRVVNQKRTHFMVSKGFQGFLEVSRPEKKEKSPRGIQ